MTGPEHYRRAEQLLESVTRRGKGDLEDPIVVSNDQPGTYRCGSSACRPRAGRRNGA